MKKSLVLFLLVSLLGVAGAITLDGKLDEPQWKEAIVHSDFQDFKGSKNKVTMPQTSFRICNDGDNLYFGIRCDEQCMAKIKAPVQPYPWGCDLVEIFLSPACKQDEFYQFVVSAGNVRWCQYYYEGGHIKPDPGYAPLWDSAIYLGKDFWSCEVRIPLAGFYHTRNRIWQTEWLVNITRDRVAEAKGSITWSPLIYINQESSLFRKLKGFPMRQDKDDFSIESIAAEISNFDGKLYHGKLKLNIYTALSGTHSIAYQGRKEQVKLSSGENKIELPCSFDKVNCRSKVKFVLDDGETLGREYPIMLEYEPVSIKLTTPGYSDTFYPGQDKSKIIGIVRQRSKGKLTLEIQGQGIKPQKQEFHGDKLEHPFAFDATGIGVDGALLTAKVEGGQVQVKVNAPAPTKNRMVWIENGYLVQDGKPIFVRMIEGFEGFGVGRRFNEYMKTRRASFCTNNDTVLRRTLEPSRLLKGIEAEAVRDIEPSPELLKKIKDKIESMRNQDFTYYFLIDEPECRNISPVYLRHLYKYVKSLDLFHPVMICSRAGARYADCADYITAHPYWAPYFDGRGNRLLTIQLQKLPNYFNAWLAPNKASALVPQCFSYRNYWNRMADYPTLDEMDAAIWISVVTGVTGIETFHYHDLGDRAVMYEGTRYFMQSLERLDKFLLTPDKKTLDAPEGMFSAIFTANGEKLLILVNVTGKTAHFENSLKGLYEFRGTRTFNGAIDLKPNETALFTTKKMDQGLPSKAEIAALIEQKEKQRLTNKSILFEKGFQINMQASGFEHFGREEWTHSKLFDGVDNMLAWSASRWKPSWLELSFSTFVPEFTRLAVNGGGIENMVLQYWKDGEWKKLDDVAEVKVEKYTTSYTCREKVRTVKLRMDFPTGKESVELYEVEAFDDAPQQAHGNGQQQSPVLDEKENVLWRRDGTNVKLGKGGWDDKRLRIFGDDQGRLVISGDKQLPKEISPATNINIPINEDYPWLVCKLDSVRMNQGSYHAWCVQGPGLGAYFQDSSPVPGIYTFNLKETNLIGKKQSYIAIYAYCEELVFNSISIVKKAECMATARIEGDTLHVRAELLKPAESVSARLSYKFKNQTPEYQLKPLPDNKLIWEGTFKLDKLKQNFKPGQLDLRLDVLGGGLPVPVFSKIYKL